MSGDISIGRVERMMKQHERGIRTRQEVVDGALGLLAYKGQFDLVEPVTRLLLERFKAEVERWADWDEGHPEAGFHWMPYNDSRLVGEYYGGIAGGEYTDDQKCVFVDDMRYNVQRVKEIVQSLVAGNRGTVGKRGT